MPITRVALGGLAGFAPFGLYYLVQGALPEFFRQVILASLFRGSAVSARVGFIERLQRIAQVAHERSRALRSRIQGAGERRRDLEDEARRLEADLAQSADGHVVLDSHFGELSATVTVTGRRLAQQEQRNNHRDQHGEVNQFASQKIRTIHAAISRDFRKK